uniref:Uncharacterized protein n=1 Tax=Ditylenchus dipsaci TaxID=166011 RepID=A0A915DGD3_9BILA
MSALCVRTKWLRLIPVSGAHRQLVCMSSSGKDDDSGISKKGTQIAKITKTGKKPAPAPNVSSLMNALAAVFWEVDTSSHASQAAKVVHSRQKQPQIGSTDQLDQPSSLDENAVSMKMKPVTEPKKKKLSRETKQHAENRLMLGKKVTSSLPQNQTIHSLISDLKASFSQELKQAESEELLESSEQSNLKETTGKNQFNALSDDRRNITGLKTHYFPSSLKLKKKALVKNTGDCWELNHQQQYSSRFTPPSRFQSFGGDRPAFSNESRNREVMPYNKTRVRLFQEIIKNNPQMGYNQANLKADQLFEKAQGMLYMPAVDSVEASDDKEGAEESKISEEDKSLLDFTIAELRETDNRKFSRPFFASDNVRMLSSDYVPSPRRHVVRPPVEPKYTDNNRLFDFSDISKMKTKILFESTDGLQERSLGFWKDWDDQLNLLDKKMLDPKTQ